MKKAEFDQEEVLKSLAQGNELAFIQIFDRYNSKVFSSGLKLFKSREMAQEVVQEVFIKLWEKRSSYADVRELEAYLHVLTRNLGLDMLRSRAREIANLYKYAKTRDLSENSTENMVQTREYEELVSKVVENLPRQQKQVYKLSREGGFNHHQIAEHLGVSDSTVNTLMNRALDKIRKNLKPYLGCAFPFLPVILNILEEQGK